MHRLLRIGAAILLGGFLYIGGRPLGPLPPLGSFLDPAGGVWAVARRAELPRAARGSIPGLEAPVEVLYDDRAVPHIFATSANDAYRALGYVVARDRLFQIELQTRATAGTLTELLGPSVLDLDRQQRRLGLARSADRSFAALIPGSPAAQSMAAYAAGVNAWIAGMRRADLPLEYRLLNAWPMRWEPRYAVYLLRRMGWTLAFQGDDLRRHRVADLVGPEAAAALFPINSPIQDPIQPGPGRYPRFDWKRLPAPEPRVRESAAVAQRHDGTAAWGSVQGMPRDVWGGVADAAHAAGGGGEGGLGSNNWAVAPSRSATGHALLAGDPHLDLTLPSTWYEAHLVVRRIGGSADRRFADSVSRRSADLDVYGVTIPGAPGVVIGFNRDVAWSLTNTEADVLDYYAEKLDDPARPARYLLDGEWVPLERSIEVYRGRQGERLGTDTVYFTHRGPVLDPHRNPLSIRWTVLETASELIAFHAGAEARSADGFLRNFQGYRAPAQNAVAADRAGNIVIRSTGRFPIRPGDGTGLVIRDGATRGSDWQGDWLVREYPFGRNPARGFLSSANQQPIDPRVDSMYLGANWGFPWRAMRINQLLRADSSVAVGDMRRWQTDPGSTRADYFVPFFLRAAGVGGSAGAKNQPSVDPAIGRSAELLAQWDRRYTRDNTRAVLFEMAMGCLPDRVWDELEDSSGRRVYAPREVILADLLQDPKSVWWDRRSTRGVVEDRDEVLGECLAEALAQARKRHGEPDGGGWRWDRVQHTNIHHLLQIAPFSVLDIPMQGGPSTLNPSSGRGTNGASWRMVVELGPEVRAWGTYPGGQSGNPVSRRYLDRLPVWEAGELDSLRVPHEPGELTGRTSSRLTLTPDT